MKPYRLQSIITHGGRKPNIIPEEASLEYSLRIPSQGELAIAKEKVLKCFHAAAMATGCEVEISYDEKPYQNVINNQILADLYKKNAESLGVEFCTDESKLGESLGSTDMGNVTHVVPGIHPVYYIGTEAANHTRDFAEAAGAKTAQKYTLDQGKALAMAAIETFHDTSLCERMMKKFEEDLIIDRATQ